jgi:uncharacterized protein (DUF849 family)
VITSQSKNKGKILIQAALNGTRAKTEHPAVPVSIEELVRDAVASVAAGAGAIHLHPRDADGNETLDPAIVDQVVTRVRDACGVPVGVTTGAWIEADLERRLLMIRAWTAPDYSSVNLVEEGALEVMHALLSAGVGIEAGISYARDIDVLVNSGLADRVTRILVEPTAEEIAETPTVIADIHALLDRHGITTPRLQHSDGDSTWSVLSDAITQGWDTRIGLEDTLQEPTGITTTGNPSLIATAVRLRAETQS